MVQVILNTQRPHIHTSNSKRYDCMWCKLFTTTLRNNSTRQRLLAVCTHLRWDQYIGYCKSGELNPPISDRTVDDGHMCSKVSPQLVIGLLLLPVFQRKMQSQCLPWKFLQVMLIRVYPQSVRTINWNHDLIFKYEVPASLKLQNMYQHLLDIHAQALHFWRLYTLMWSIQSHTVRLTLTRGKTILTWLVQSFPSIYAHALPLRRLYALIWDIQSHIVGLKLTYGKIIHF